MKAVTMKAKNVAEILFKEKERLPHFEFYLSKTEGGDFEYGCDIGVIKFADSLLVIGNYFGGGCPLCCDLTGDDDSSALEESMENWLKELDCDKDGDGFVLYVDAAGSRGVLLPEVTIVIDKGMLVDVYSNLETLGVELIDLDQQDTDAEKATKIALEDVEKDYEKGRLFKHW